MAGANTWELIVGGVVGAVFTGPVAIVTGCLAAIPAGTGGYVAGKTGAEAAWDAIADRLK